MKTSLTRVVAWVVLVVVAICTVLFSFIANAEEVAAAAAAVHPDVGVVDGSLKAAAVAALVQATRSLHAVAKAAKAFAENLGEEKEHRALQREHWKVEEQGFAALRGPTPKPVLLDYTPVEGIRP